VEFNLALSRYFAIAIVILIDSSIHIILYKICSLFFFSVFSCYTLMIFSHYNMFSKCGVRMGVLLLCFDCVSHLFFEGVLRKRRAENESGIVRIISSLVIFTT